MSSTDSSPETSDAYFRAAFASAGHGMVICELDGRFAAVNDRLCALVNRTPDELTRLRFHDITHPDDLPGSLAHVERLISGDISHYQVDKRYRRADGNWVPVRLHVGLVHDNVGRPRHLVAHVQDLTGTAKATAEAAAAREKREHAYIQMLRTIARMVEKGDRYTAAHQGRVSALARRITVAMGLGKHAVTATQFGGLMHDVGKIHVPQQILAKPGRLTDNELAVVREHVEVGYDILRRADLPWPVAEIARQHHERFDGGGYPRGLKGCAIAIEARIVAVADVYDSIANFRPYREARGRDVALAELVGNAGRLYDPDVVQACSDVTA